MVLLGRKILNGCCKLASRMAVQFDLIYELRKHRDIAG